MRVFSDFRVWLGYVEHKYLTGRSKDSSIIECTEELPRIVVAGFWRLAALVGGTYGYLRPAIGYSTWPLGCFRNTVSAFSPSSDPTKRASSAFLILWACPISGVSGERARRGNSTFLESDPAP